jgi:hypothetical protein
MMLGWLGGNLAGDLRNWHPNRLLFEVSLDRKLRYGAKFSVDDNHSQQKVNRRSTIFLRAILSPGKTMARCLIHKNCGKVCESLAHEIPK